MEISRAISPYQTLNRHLIENSREIADQSAKKALLYSIASKTCMAAFLAIAATAIVISVGVPISLPPAILITLVISTVPLQIGSAYCSQQATVIDLLAKTAKDQANALEKIEHWSSQDINLFLKEHNISTTAPGLAALTTKNAKEPLKVLLPAIAQYHYWSSETERLFLRYQANIQNQAADPHLRNAGRSQAWSILEKGVMPAALRAAFMLQVISNPLLQTDWEHFGKCAQKSFEQRKFDRMIDNSDDYFIFEEFKRKPLQLKELLPLIDPLKLTEIQKKLFPL